MSWSVSSSSVNSSIGRPDPSVEPLGPLCSAPAWRGTPLPDRSGTGKCGREGSERGTKQCEPVFRGSGPPGWVTPVRREKRSAGRDRGGYERDDVVPEPAEEPVHPVALEDVVPGYPL